MWAQTHTTTTQPQTKDTISEQQSGPTHCSKTRWVCDSFPCFPQAFISSVHWSSVVTPQLVPVQLPFLLIQILLAASLHMHFIPHLHIKLKKLNTPFYPINIPSPFVQKIPLCPMFCPSPKRFPCSNWAQDEKNEEISHFSIKLL